MRTFAETPPAEWERTYTWDGLGDMGGPCLQGPYYCRTGALRDMEEDLHSTELPYLSIAEPTVHRVAVPAVRQYILDGRKGRVRS